MKKKNNGNNHQPPANVGAIHINQLKLAIYKYLKELNSLCLHNCTIDLANALHGLFIINDESHTHLAEAFEHFDDDRKRGVWDFMWEPENLNQRPDKINKTILAIMYAELAVLTSHDISCKIVNGITEHEHSHVPSHGGARVIQFKKKEA